MFQAHASGVIFSFSINAFSNTYSIYLDKQLDHSFVVRWESKAVIAVCNVFALQLDSHLSLVHKNDNNASEVEQHVSNGGP